MNPTKISPRNSVTDETPKIEELSLDEPGAAPVSEIKLDNDVFKIDDTQNISLGNDIPSSTTLPEFNDLGGPPPANTPYERFLLTASSFLWKTKIY